MSEMLLHVHQNMLNAEEAVVRQQHALLSYFLYPRFSQGALAERMAWGKLYHEGDLSPEVLRDFEKMRPRESAWWSLGWGNPLLVGAYSSALLYTSSRARMGAVFRMVVSAAPWAFFHFWKTADIGRVLDFAEYSAAVAEGKRLRAAIEAEVTPAEKDEFRRLFPGQSVAEALAAYHRVSPASKA